MASNSLMHIDTVKAAYRRYARIYDTLGSYQPAFMTFAALNAVSLGLLCLVRRETRG